MEKKDIYNCPTCAGIYLLKNKINGKYFIGKAIKLQKCIKAHLRDYQYDKYPYVSLYRAIRKYGIENFELLILKTFTNSLSWNTRNQLDFWEKEYIEQYDSNNNGYNNPLEDPISQELGGSLKAISLKSREIVTGNSVEELSNKLDIPVYIINKCLNKTQSIGSKEWIIYQCADDFPEYSKYDYDSDEIKDVLREQFKELSTKENILDYIKNNPECSYGEISQNYTLSKKDFFNYKKEVIL